MVDLVDNDADDNTDNEEQKEDSGKERVLFSDFSFHDMLMLRSYTENKYRVLDTQKINEPFAEVAGQPPQA